MSGPGSPLFSFKNWLRGLDLNQRPSGYEPDELPDCSTPRFRYYASCDACATESRSRALIHRLETVEKLSAELFSSG